ncbi:glycosyltransferase family 4 protein [Ramlibacter sp.]|uniref:glycosyltransferase family 4 protein n=1 Tax=Ramlibacter sp. TaxID=1917967 RepID=UPI003D0C5FF7
MRVALIAAHYPPMRTSAAVQMHDLAREFDRQGHEVVVIAPTVGLGASWSTERLDGVTVLRVDAPRSADLGYVRRTIGELVAPLVAVKCLRKSPYARTPWDLVAWYSPTIFHGPLIAYLKQTTDAHAYLILRDIFPEWAVDLGILRKGPVYAFLKAIANLQYWVADTIGVQTPSNLAYLSGWRKAGRRELEVLQNWQRPSPDIGSSIDISRTPLAGRAILAYVGNMGVAQGMDILIDLAEAMAGREDVGFVFVGRGSEVERLRADAARRGLTNVLFFEEVDSGEMPGLLAQCHVGLLTLDPRHRTHNIPGKFLTYLLAGVPTLARVNADTDLQHLIEQEDVGRVCTGDDAQVMKRLAEELLGTTLEQQAMAQRCRTLARRMFSPAATVTQMVAAATARTAPAPAAPQ